MGEAAALEKDGVERDLQEALAAAPEWCGEGFRLVRREWPTDIGPVDLMCRDADDGWVAVEIKRVGTIDAVEQLTRYLERLRARPGAGGLPRRARRPAGQAPGPRARRGSRPGLRRGRPRGGARRARAGPDAVRLAGPAPGRREGRRRVGRRAPQPRSGRAPSAKRSRAPPRRSRTRSHGRPWRRPSTRRPWT